MKRIIKIIIAITIVILLSLFTIHILTQYGENASQTLKNNYEKKFDKA